MSSRLHQQLLLVAATALGLSQAAPSPGLPMVINTWGGPFTAATDAAYDFIRRSDSATAALDAVEVGCSTCEARQCDGSVGFGGSPDENCETTLDAMIMDGASMKSGAVAGLRRIKNAVSAARAVRDRTTHSLLAGDLATAFAVSNGMREEDLTTDATRERCKAWRENNCQPNYRVNVTPDPKTSCGPYVTPAGPPPLLTRADSQVSHDTISMIAIATDGTMAAATSTNGAGFKVPGRVGDGPIVGSGSYAGMCLPLLGFCIIYHLCTADTQRPDDEVGGCGATGDGDIMLRFLPCYQALENMRNGMTPKQAAADAVRRMVRKYPAVSSGIVVVNNKGEHGGAGSGWTFTYSFRVRSDVFCWI